MFYCLKINTFRFILSSNSLYMANETITSALQCAKRQIIQISMNINRIINKYIISKYVKRENKPG